MPSLDLGRAIQDAFTVDVNTGVNHLFEDPTDTRLLAPEYDIEEKIGTSGNDRCKRHIWILKGYATIVAKFRVCNGRIEVKVKESPSRWAEFEEGMVVTPNVKSEGGRRIHKKRTVKHRRKTRRTRR